MRVEDNHAHANTIYAPTSYKHFIYLFQDVMTTKKSGFTSLTVHLPFAIDNWSQFSPYQHFFASFFIRYGEVLKQVFHIRLYWENCPIFNTKTWDLKHHQTEWKYVPQNIALCIDTGHLMMGAKSKKEAQERIENILKTRGKQIRHLHIHENNLISDQHLNPLDRKPTQRVITPDLLRQLQKGRTYIFEKPS